MKTLSIIAALGIAALAFAEPPRSRSVIPAVSNYQPGAGHYYQDAKGSYYCKDGVCRNLNLDRTRVDIVRVLQINPAYASAYSPDGYDATTQADILNELRRQAGVQAQLYNQLMAQIATISRGQVLAPAPSVPGVPAPPVVVPVALPPGPPNTAIGLAVLNLKCAACHQAGKLATDQRFTLLDAKGQLVTLTDKQKLAVIRKTRTGQMPPPLNLLGIPTVTDAEFAAIADLVGN